MKIGLKLSCYLMMEIRFCFDLRLLPDIVRPGLASHSSKRAYLGCGSAVRYPCSKQCLATSIDRVLPNQTEVLDNLRRTSHNHNPARSSLRKLTGYLDLTSFLFLINIY